MEKGHVSLRRGTSWSPGGLRKPLQATAGVDARGSECTASWGRTGFGNERTSQKTNLNRSASLSEKELKEARLKSQIIAAQLTVPSNSSSRGVQLFNRRKQRVNAFTLESCGEGSQEDAAENAKTDLSSHKLTWTERSSEEKNKDLNDRNRGNAKPASAPPERIRSAGDSMERPAKHFHKADEAEESVIQERHFLPVKEIEEQEEEARDEIKEELDRIKDEIPPGVRRIPGGEAEMNGGLAGPTASGKLPNGCHGRDGHQRASVSTPKQIVNRTARPFFSPLTVRSPEATSPVMDTPPPPPPPPSYSTPLLPAFTSPRPPAMSPPPPPPTYPTPPLPAFTNQPPQSHGSGPPSSPSPQPSRFPVSTVPRYATPGPSAGGYGPAAASKPSASASQPERKPTAVKTGILEDGAARRASRKSMFTFKEKPTVAPNPELLSLVQGVDERKKHGQRSVPEPASEEELLALGAEASNFLAKEEDTVEEAKAPEWSSCLKSSGTRPRAEHKVEQTLNNASGKGAELFAKRQSRMEKYVIDDHSANLKVRSPSPTMSLPPSWVYPSNMPGRVKAIARNSDISSQLSQTLKPQQITPQKLARKAPAPEPKKEPPPVENGCSKIETDLSRHRPYQLNSSLFILKPVKDPMSTLPRGAPQARDLKSSQSFSRQTSLPSDPPSRFGAQCTSPRPAFTPARAAETPSDPGRGQRPAAFPSERVSSPRPGVQAPRPTFSAKKAGIEKQQQKESPPGETRGETPTPTRMPNLIRRFSSCSQDDTPLSTWNSRHQTHQPAAGSHSGRSVTSPDGVRCQSPMGNRKIQLSTVTPVSNCRPASARSPWGSRCQSPVALQINQTSNLSPVHASRPLQTSTSASALSPPWGSRCQSPVVSQHAHTSNLRSPQTSADTPPLSPPWGSRCQSPMVSQHTQPSTISSGSTSRPFQSSAVTSPRSPSWSSRCQSPMATQHAPSSAFVSTPSSKLSKTPSSTSPVSTPWFARAQSPAPSSPITKSISSCSGASPVPPFRDSRCLSPNMNSLDSKANHRMLAKNIINAAKRKNSPSPGALSSHSLPISPVGAPHQGYDCHKPPVGPFQSRPLGAQSPTFTSPPPTPTERICSPVRLYNSRSLTDSDASVESEDSGLRSSGLHAFNTCPRGWGGSLRVKKTTMSTDL